MNLYVHIYNRGMAELLEVINIVVKDKNELLRMKQLEKERKDNEHLALQRAIFDILSQQKADAEVIRLAKAQVKAAAERAEKDKLMLRNQKSS